MGQIYIVATSTTDEHDETKSSISTIGFVYLHSLQKLCDTIVFPSSFYLFWAKNLSQNLEAA